MAIIVKGGPNSAIYLFGATQSVTNLTTPINPKTGRPYGLSNLTICYNLEPCDDAEPCTNGETAFGGNAKGGGNAWWFYLDTQVSSTGIIYSGQNETDGIVSVNYNAGNNTTTVTIDLGSLQLQDVAEAVKIQGYNENTLPSSRPAAGLFTTYKGNELIVTFSGQYRYYVIHLDVLDCTFN